MTNPPDGREAALLACPFCGDKAVLVCDDSSDRMSQWDYRVYCQEDSCGGAGPMLRDAEGAIAAWNRRATATPVQPEPAAFQVCDRVFLSRSDAYCFRVGADLTATSTDTRALHHEQHAVESRSQP